MLGLIYRIKIFWNQFHIKNQSGEGISSGLFIRPAFIHPARNYIILFFYCMP